MPSPDAACDTAPLHTMMSQPVQQGKKPPVKVPWRQFACAGMLIIIGTVVIIVSSLILEGVIDSESMCGLSEILLVVGLLVLLCGLCYVPMTILASRRMPGYSLENIPEFGCPAFTYY